MSSPRIALIDYGAGNLASVRKGLRTAGAEVVSPRTPAEVEHLDALVVPGVGHFQATAALDGPWRQAISSAMDGGVPLLGICLGLQWLFEGSTEAPAIRGLGALRGTCSRLPGGQKVPHVGWNALEITRPSRLLEGLASGTQVYFTHSFAAPVTEHCVAATIHGARFAAAVEKGCLFGVQFHPEKSADAGLTILRNFVRLAATTRGER